MAPAVAAANSASALVIPRLLPALWATCAAASEIFTVGCSLEKGNKKLQGVLVTFFLPNFLKGDFWDFGKLKKKDPKMWDDFPLLF